MERAHRHVTALIADEPEDPLAHLGRRLVRERDREDPPRRDVAHADEVGDPVSEHARLARPGAREDEERALGRRDRAGLLGVQARDDRLGAGGRVAGHDAGPEVARLVGPARAGDDREPFGVRTVSVSVRRRVDGLRLSPAASTCSALFTRIGAGRRVVRRLVGGRLAIVGRRLVSEGRKRELVGQGLRHRLILGSPANWASGTAKRP